MQGAMAGHTHRAFPVFGIGRKALQEEGAFAGYASVFHVPDRQRDIILPGAFSRTLKERAEEVKLLWQHHFEEPIGVFTALREDGHGLYVEGRLLLEVQKAREAHALLKAGAADGLSIGYTVVASEYDDTAGMRLIQDLDLWEISLVTFPANADATVTHVKQVGEDAKAPASIREFEQFLRGHGFSRAKAREIAAKGFKQSDVVLSVEEQAAWVAAQRSGDVFRVMEACQRGITALLR